MINQQILLGNIGFIGELSKKETEFLEFSVATTESYKNSKGEWVNDTQWHSVKTFGKIASYIHKYASKGDVVHVIGRTKTETWTNKDDTETSRNVVIAQQVTLVTRKKSSKNESTGEQSEEETVTNTVSDFDAPTE